MMKSGLNSVSDPSISSDQGDAGGKKAPSRAKRIVLWIIGILVGLVVVVLVGFNIYIRTTYGAFYSTADEQFEIPGIHAGFICQDLDYYDEGDCWFFSGYASGEGSSPLYRRDADGSSVKFFAVLPDGTAYTGHGSGVATSSDYAFLTCDDGYLVFNVADFAGAGAGDVVRAIDRVELELTPAFLNIENDTLYVGTFHLLPNYAAPDHHHVITPDGSENAGMMFAYLPVTFSDDEQMRYGFSDKAAGVYSLPDRVQGMCVLPSGEIVLSTSYGFAPSHLLTYRLDGTDEWRAVKDPARAQTADAGLLRDNAGSSQEAESPYTFFVDGRSVPLYFLDSTNLVSNLEAPPMTEGIEYHDGRVWISEESASNKYLFGKLYGAGDVYAVEDDVFTGE